MNWPWTKHIRVQVIPCQATKLRLAEWQMDPKLCNLAAKALSDATVELMVAVLHNEHPAFLSLPENVDFNERVVLQAKAEGYSMALANLEALGQFKKLMVMPEATFEEEEMNLPK